MKLTYKSYGNYSGPCIIGDVKYVPSINPTHWERVFTLTVGVESPNSCFGSINMYDGCGVTAGLHQAILVYPKELSTEDFSASDDQASLPQLLRLFEYIPNHSSTYEKLKYAFKQESWYVAPDNKLRYSLGKAVQIGNKLVRVNPGDIVFGADLRNTLTPVEGKVASKGPLWEQSQKWALLFHEVFSDPLTYAVQIKFGIDHSIHASKSIKLSNGLSVSQFIYGSTDSQEPFADCQELDLAMMLFWCHAVNAPAVAKKCMEQAIKQTNFTGYKVGNKKELGKVLLRILGTSRFGRWDDDIVGGRYQRARDTMIKMNYWEPKHFAALGVMPKDFRE